MKKSNPLKLMILFIMVLFSNHSYSNDLYQYEASWPNLKQPWYFNHIVSSVYDKSNNAIFIFEAASATIYKMTPQGQVVTRWGGKGKAKGKFSTEKVLDINTKISLAIDSLGNIYAADPLNNRVQKFTNDGEFIAEYLYKDKYIHSIAINFSGDLIALTRDEIIISSNISKKKKYIEYTEENVTELGVDNKDNIYIASEKTIFKYSPIGENINSWHAFDPTIRNQESGSSIGYQGLASGMTFDSKNNIYLNSPTSGTILGFDENGLKIYEKKYFKAFHEIYPSPHENNYSSLSGRHVSLITDNNDNLFIFDEISDFIIKLNKYGDIVDHFGSSKTKQILESSGPRKITLFPDGRILFARGTKLTTIDESKSTYKTYKHVFLYENSNKDFYFEDIEYYDSNHIIAIVSQVQDSSTFFKLETISFLTKINIVTNEVVWNKRITENKSLSSKTIVLDGNNTIYISATRRSLIFPDSENDGFILIVDKDGDATKRINLDAGVEIITSTITSDGNLYFLSKYFIGGQNLFIFNPDSLNISYLSLSLTEEVSADGIVSIDNNYGIIHSDKTLKIYNLEGEVLDSFILGGRGSGQQQFVNASDIKYLNKKIYIADDESRKLMIYKEKTISIKSKAIIIAGGSKSNNTLWNATQSNANLAYNTLKNTGYNDDNIFYISSNLLLDLNGNGEYEEVDDIPTLNSVYQAITQWAVDANELFIYMVDHGGDETFLLSEQEILKAKTLNTWISNLQEQTGIKVTILYDACSSGTFLPVLGNTLHDRSIITSTKGTENAYFLEQGALSFSNLFWGEIFNGKSIQNAFVYANSNILTSSLNDQNPQYDSDGDGIANTDFDFTLLTNTYIGQQKNLISNSLPTLGNVSQDSIGEPNSKTFKVSEAIDEDNISSVWGVVRTPYLKYDLEGVPIQGFPRFGLVKQKDGSYRGTYSDFDQPGTYRIAFYAKDTLGNISQPKILPITIEDNLSRKAIIIAGVDDSGLHSSAISHQANNAYEVLMSQGYAPKNIEYLSASSIDSTIIDHFSTKDNVKYYLTEWAKNKSLDLTLYLVGDLKNSEFKLNDSEKVNTKQLDQWLDILQEKIDGIILVIHEGSYSGHLISSITPPLNKQRIIITSSSLSEASFTSYNSISFSYYFWNQIRQGSTIAKAFLYAQAAMSDYQSPQLNDNGNTTSNEKSDRRAARQHKIGVGILLAADEPKLQTVSPNVALENNETESTLWVDGIVSTSQIEKVWVVITPPEFSPTLAETPPPYEIELPKTTDNHWQLTHNGFSIAGSYHIAFYARDINKRISQPTLRYLYQPIGADAYEADNDFDSAKSILTSTTSPQWHNFHQKNDTDFIRFTAKKQSGQYTIKVNAEGSKADPIVDLYDEQHNLIKRIDNTGQGELELTYFSPTTDNTYYLKISPYLDKDIEFPIHTGYTVQVYPSNGETKVKIIGSIFNQNGEPIVGATVRSIFSDGHGDDTKTDESGGYIFQTSKGSYDLSVKASGYKTQIKTMSSEEGAEETEIFTLEVLSEEEPDIPTVEPDTVVIRSAELPKTKVESHAKNIVMQVLKIRIPEGGADLRSITFKGKGTGNEATDIQQVRLYLDTNKNKHIDSGDEWLSEGVFTQDDGEVTLSLASKRHFNEGSVQLLVGVDFQ